MTIYILLIVSYLVLSLLEFVSNMDKLKKKKFVKFAYGGGLLFPIWLIVSFRDVTVGNDTNMYEYLYEQFTSESLLVSFVFQRLEKGFITFCWLLGQIGLDFHGFLLVISSIICVSFAIFIVRYSKNWAFSWFLFITLLFLPRSMNICREMMAVSLSLYAFHLLLSHKIKTFILCALLLTLIHKSAILLLLVVILLKLKSPTLRLIFVVVSGFILAFVFEPVMSMFISFNDEKYQYLADSKYTEVDGGTAKFFNLLFAVFAYLSMMIIPYFRKTHKYIYQADVWRCIALCAIILNIGGLNFGLADRASLYYISAYLILLPNAVMSLAPGARFMFYGFNASLLSAYFFAVMIYRNNWHGIVPYSFWWN